MSFLGDLLGGLTGGIGTIVSGLFNNNSADNRQEDAQSFSAQQYATRYQTSVKDIAAAGLNPGLAYGGITGSPPTSSAASSAGMGDLGATFNNSRTSNAQATMQAAQTDNIKADTANKDAQRDLMVAQAAASWGTADQAQANTGLIGANVQKIKAEIPKINQETSNLQEQRQVILDTARMLQAQAKLMQEQGQSQAQVRAHLQAQVSQLASQTKLNTFDIEAAEKMGNMGRDLGQLKPFFDMVNGVVRAQRGH